MAVKMRLTRLGDKKNPFYRIVVIDSHKARDGQYVELLGTYNPVTEELKLDAEKAQKWIDNGVQPTETVKTLLAREGVAKKAKEKKAKAPAKKAPAKKAPAKKAPAKKAEPALATETAE